MALLWVVARATNLVENWVERWGSWEQRLVKTRVEEWAYSLVGQWAVESGGAMGPRMVSETVVNWAGKLAA